MKIDGAFHVFFFFTAFFPFNYKNYFQKKKRKKKKPNLTEQRPNKILH